MVGVCVPGALRVCLLQRCSRLSRDVECPARTDANVSGAGASNLSNSRWPRGRGAALAVEVQQVAIGVCTAGGNGEYSGKQRQRCPAKVVADRARLIIEERRQTAPSDTSARPALAVHFQGRTAADPQPACLAPGRRHQTAKLGDTWTSACILFFCLDNRFA